MKMGTTHDRMVERKLLDGAPVTLTPCVLSLAASSGSIRVVLVRGGEIRHQCDLLIGEKANFLVGYGHSPIAAMVCSETQ